MAIINDEALMFQLSIDLKIILKKMTIDILELLRGFILSEVYDAYDPKMYERMHDFGEGGFYESWTRTKVETEGALMASSRTFSNKIFSDPEKMAWIPELYVHGQRDISADAPDDDRWSDFFLDVSKKESDRRKNLDEYIAEGTHYDFAETDSGPEFARPRDYWSPVIDFLDAGFLGEAFENAAKSRGMKVIKGW